jgi:hypothetical protein
MKRLMLLLTREDGMAMATVVMLIGVLTILSIVLIDQVTAESNRAASSVKQDATYQAAEAGINDYIAKLIDDSEFYDRFVAKGESTRQPSPSGATVGPGHNWTSGVSWTYPATAEHPDGKTTWYQGTGSSTSLEDGYAYNLMVSPPVATGAAPRNYVTVVSTGCKLNTAGTACDSTVPKRAIETRLVRTTPADFFVMFNDDQNFGDTDDTTHTSYTNYGKIFISGNVCHNGTAYGDVMAEGSVNNSTWCRNQGYNTTPSINLQIGGTPPALARILTPTSTPALNTVVKISGTEIFTRLQKSLGVSKASALQNGAYYDVTGTTAWSFVFRADGKYDLKRCTGAGDPSTTAPSSCTTYSGSPFAIGNGSIYTAQTAVISYPSESFVNGRVTVASGNNIVVANDIHYSFEPATKGDDVLGLVASQNVIVASYVPSVFQWRAAVIAENGTRKAADCSRETKSQVTFRGSVAANQNGCMSMFTTRINYADDVLKYLTPPYYPSIDGTESTVLFREVPPSYVPPLGS